MKTLLITTLIVFGILLMFWRYIMNNMEPRRRYSGESLFEANKREGGYVVLRWFICIAIIVSIILTKLILWFGFLEPIGNLK